MTYGAYAFGAGAYGARAYAGAASTGPGGGGGAPTAIYFLEANDRNQIVACVSDGQGQHPRFVYWNPAPGAWPEFLGAPNPNDYPAVFATNDLGGVPDAEVELPDLVAPAGYEMLVDYLDVDVHLRPSTVGDVDGGLGSHTIGFTVGGYGWAIDGTSHDGTDGFATSVFPLDVGSFSADPADVSGTPVPHVRHLRFPVRGDQRLVGLRLQVAAMVGCEILAIEPYGTLQPRS
jgi:hypothetical protein